MLEGSPYLSAHTKDHFMHTRGDALSSEGCEDRLRLRRRRRVRWAAEGWQQSQQAAGNVRQNVGGGGG